MSNYICQYNDSIKENMQQKQRPLGVTIIAILAIIGGIALLSTGAVLL